MALLNISISEVLYGAPYVAAEVLNGETRDVTSTSADTAFTITTPPGPCIVTLSAAEDMYVSIAPVADASSDAKRRLILGGTSPAFMAAGGQQIKARLA